MQILGDLVEMARVCAAQARLTNSRDVAHTLWELAADYHGRAQKRAIELKSGNVPDIGDPPALLK